MSLDKKQEQTQFEKVGQLGNIILPSLTLSTKGLILPPLNGAFHSRCQQEQHSVLEFRYN